MNKILEHNQKYELGIVSYKLGINQFTDKFSFEINNLMNRLNVTNDSFYNDNNRLSFILPENVVIPKEINWLEKGAVTEVKDQGQCGSCYAFSVIGALEGQHYRASNELISLSEQNIIDCSGTFGNLGCWGGWMVNTYRYIINNEYVNTENDYPYKGATQPCQYDVKKRGVSMKNFVEITPSKYL